MITVEFYQAAYNMINYAGIDATPENIAVLAKDLYVVATEFPTHLTANNAVYVLNRRIGNNLNRYLLSLQLNERNAMPEPVAPEPEVSETSETPQSEPEETEEEPEVITCDVCSELEDDCTCATCSNCDTKVTEVCSNCEHCPDCCHCSNCRSCRERVERVCDTCSKCDDCCSCSNCDNCGETVPSTCGSCSNCESCCTCSGDEDSSEGPRRGIGHGMREADKLHFKNNPLTRLCGIELELSSIPDSDVLFRWAQSTGAGLVEDGSLPDEGVEVVTRPMSGDILLRDCASLGEALRVSKATISNDCGLHVHVDARDYTQADLRRLMILYASVERTLFELSARSRIDNKYCIPCGASYLNWLRSPSKTKTWSKEWRKTLTANLYGEANRYVSGLKHDKYHSSRYNALNLHTFFYRKTIEFRMHEAHLSPEVFSNWALLCGWIVQRAYVMSESDIYSLIRASSNCEDVLREILPSSVMSNIESRLQIRRQARIEGHSFENTERQLQKLGCPEDVLTSHVFQVTPLSRQLGYIQYDFNLQEEQPICAV